MSHQPVIDIHAHYRYPGQEFVPPPSWVSEERRRDQLRHDEILRSFDRIVEVAEQVGVDTRVLSLPAASRFADYDTAPARPKEIAELNDYLAGGVRDHPGRLLGLATVDAFDGERAAAETRRAVEELGLSGIVVDSARADTFLGAPETVPTLAEAARLGVPVFVHPTGTSLTPALIAQAGQLGSSYGRGLANGVALLSLIHRGLLDSIPGLRIVFTTLGIGALGIAGVWRARGGLAAADGRWQVSFDTMGFDPQNVAFLVSVLGADRVLLGSDFPHQVDADPQRVANALDGAGLSPTDQALVRGGNAAKLLHRRPAAVPAAAG
ncbi:amidohydrolase family protein [Micromonospora echinofusca]|uniref:Amidohydrolase family protein n=1 Tax=Micromonospora echinofusca TaxID=47858 RepID=A0ABS3VQH2_MICEH|nr:amidohydrolase family protein [Micromonospora echinofusca]MBO4206765.1 amidohydrolase family protein [Micromonospora echinofusca]